MLILMENRISDIHWSKPVRFEVERGRVRKVNGPLAALDYLVNRIEPEAPEYGQKARRICCSALRHEACPEEARALFIDAAKAAHFNVR